jgi:hypothetical protein
VSDSSLVVLDSHRALVPDVVLPSPPPTRIYIGAHQYKIEAPRIALPPLINTMKATLNWISAFGRTARNVFYLLKGSGGTGSTSDPLFLSGVAGQIMSSIATALWGSLVNNTWTLNGVTVKDNGGTSASSSSTAAPIVGGSSGQGFPPQVALVLSWKIAESYRGGKPRWYMPGVPASAVSGGDSAINPTFAGNWDSAATTFMNDLNSHPVSGTPITLGTVSHYTGHTIRPTPLFRAFFDVKVHERLDSQRRRSGKEITFGSTP